MDTNQSKQVNQSKVNNLLSLLTAMVALIAVSLLAISIANAITFSYPLSPEFPDEAQPCCESEKCGLLNIRDFERWRMECMHYFLFFVYFVVV